MIGQSGPAPKLAYRDRYPANRNPQLVSARLTDGDYELAALPGGRTVQIHVAWSPDAAERFIVLRDDRGGDWPELPLTVD